MKSFELYIQLNTMQSYNIKAKKNVYVFNITLNKLFQLFMYV